MRVRDAVVRVLEQRLNHWWDAEAAPHNEPKAPARLRSLGALLGQYAGVGGDSGAVAPAVESAVRDCWRDADRLGTGFGVVAGAALLIAGLSLLLGIVLVTWGL